MKSNRRKFLQYSGLTGVSMALSNMMKGFASNGSEQTGDALNHRFNKDHFNMCGYAAPKLETVRIGFIGLGNRGPAAVERMSHVKE
jgi:hypothetical protein